MSRGNRFFEIDGPIRWFRAVGLSPSNTHVGSSRAIDVVHEQVLAMPGDVLHDLGGASFLVRKDGKVESGRLRLPKHLFEKTYSVPETDGDLLARMATRGLCHEVPQPAGRVEYHAARKAADAKRFPDCTGSAIREGYVESPVLASLRDAVAAAGLAEAAAGAGATLRLTDVGMGGEPNSLDCTVHLKLAGGRSLGLGAAATHDRLTLIDSEEGGFVSALGEAGDAGLPVEHRSGRIAFVPVAEAEAVMRALAGYVRDGVVAAPDAPAP